MRFVELINAPIEPVFDFCADERNAAPLLPAKATLTKESPGPIGAGTIFRLDAGRLTTRVQIAEYERPRRLVKLSGRRASVDTFRSDGGATIIESESRWPYLDAPVLVWPILVLATPVLMAMQSEIHRRSTGLLRTAVEPQGASAVGEPLTRWPLRQKVMLGAYWLVVVGITIVVIWRLSHL